MIVDIKARWIFLFHVKYIVSFVNAFACFCNC